jgi:hypothetical protein
MYNQVHSNTSLPEPDKGNPPDPIGIPVTVDPLPLPPDFPRRLAKIYNVLIRHYLECERADAAQHDGEGR